VQVAALVCVIPEQLWFRHAVEVLQNRHLPPPSHAPSSPQDVLAVVLQHTPSVQFPLTHSGPVLHADPLALVPHELLMQLLGLTQSESLVQVVLQVAVVVLQAYFPQL
jgi:hypothetical protein